MSAGIIQFNGILRKEFRNTLVQGGYLFVGHSESLFNEQDLFKYIRPAVYRSN